MPTVRIACILAVAIRRIMEAARVLTKHCNLVVDIGGAVAGAGVLLLLLLLLLLPSSLFFFFFLSAEVVPRKFGLVEAI